ncbi:MAG TPA: SpoIIE family protein phosphatase [Syntrophales bacterium]|nr:SpoIIE family protein phosphatase [Syntrophales bacterium]
MSPSFRGLEIRPLRGLAWRFSFPVLTAAACIFLFAFGYSYFYIRSLILNDAGRDAESVTMATVSRVEVILKGVERPPAFLARRLEGTKPPLREIQRQIIDLLQTNPEIFGSAVAYEPYGYDEKSLYFAPYVCRSPYGGLAPTFLGGDDYRYFYLDWYQIPRELGRPAWSEPYFDEGGGNILMATYSVPFYTWREGERAFLGVVTADISLQWLTQAVRDLTPSQAGFSFLVSRNGVFVAHPREEYVMRQSIFSIAEEHGDGDLRRIGREMIAGGKGFVELKDYFAGERAWLYYAPLPSLGWSVGVVFPAHKLFAGVRKLAAVTLFLGGAGFVALLLVIISVTRGVTQPLVCLAGKARELAGGNLDTEVPVVSSRDEVADLARSFRDMRDSLKVYIRDLTRTTAAKERIESELKIARSIQMSFLPRRFPPFPERREFRVFAVVEPAREVGGDLYDFFLLEGGRLFFAVGDVSGKGMPAALFMAVTKTLLKDAASRCGTPEGALGNLNDRLCEDNEATMFVTIGCGVLAYETGEMTLASGGHNPPVVVAGGRASFVDNPPGILLGVQPGAAYGTARLRLRPGDLVILYSDGVTEAMNEQGELFSEERLLATVAARAGGAPEEMAGAVLAAVRGFAGGAPQSDDITILVLRYDGPGGP